MKKKKKKKILQFIGVSGYIAPRHMKAIKRDREITLLLLDTYDGIGIMDSNFPQADFLQSLKDLVPL